MTATHHAMPDRPVTAPLPQAPEPWLDAYRSQQEHSVACAALAPLSWDDAAPAYAFGYGTYQVHGTSSFEDMQGQLACDWETCRGSSKLAWQQAQTLVREVWDNHARPV